MHYNNNKNGKEIENTNTQSGCGHREGQLWLHYEHYSLQSAFDYPNRANGNKESNSSNKENNTAHGGGRNANAIGHFSFSALQDVFRAFVVFLRVCKCISYKPRKGQMVPAQINLQLSIRFKISYQWTVVSVKKEYEFWQWSVAKCSSSSGYRQAKSVLLLLACHCCLALSDAFCLIFTFAIWFDFLHFHSNTTANSTIKGMAIEWPPLGRAISNTKSYWSTNLNEPLARQ